VACKSTLQLALGTSAYAAAFGYILSVTTLKGAIIYERRAVIIGRGQGLFGFSQADINLGLRSGELAATSAPDAELQRSSWPLGPI
jgi:hypothetical protein